jgi:hypothetical protein
VSGRAVSALKPSWPPFSHPPCFKRLASVELALQPRIDESEAVMRRVLVLLMTAVSFECAQLSANSQCPDSHPAVTVEIHDYVHLKSESLSTAKDIVTRA